MPFALKTNRKLEEKNQNMSDEKNQNIGKNQRMNTDELVLLNPKIALESFHISE